MQNRKTVKQDNLMTDEKVHALEEYIKKANDQKNADRRKKYQENKNEINAKRTAKSIVDPRKEEKKSQRRENYQNNKDEINAQRTENRKIKGDTIRARERKYEHDNKDKRNAQRKEKRDSNLDDANAKQRARYHKNKDRINARRKEKREEKKKQQQLNEIDHGATAPIKRKKSVQSISTKKRKLNDLASVVTAYDDSSVKQYRKKSSSTFFQPVLPDNFKNEGDQEFDPQNKPMLMKNRI